LQEVEGVRSQVEDWKTGKARTQGDLGGRLRID